MQKIVIVGGVAAGATAAAKARRISPDAQITILEAGPDISFANCGLPYYIGGDINGGVQDLTQFWTRPTLRLNPYTTPVKGLYLCSSSTPPGGGVHGMCGFHAAQAALRRMK